MFESRRKAREADDKKSTPLSASVLAPATVSSLFSETLAPGKWRIHGIHEQQALKAGLRRLDEVWETRDLDKFQSGTPKLFREALLADLISGKRSLKAVPMSDVSAAQGDVTHLTLRQLLRLRVSNLDFAPQGDNAASMQAFIQKVDSLLFQRIGKSALEHMFPQLDDATWHRVGRDLAVVSAAAVHLKESAWWVCFAGNGRFWFNPTTFKATSQFPRGGVLEITDASKVDPHSKGMQRQLDWKVCLVLREEEVSSVRLELSASAAKAGSYGANVNGPQVTEKVLASQLSGLRRTGTDLV